MSKENWYVDYVEKDLAPEEEAGFRSLIENSKTDQEVVQNLKQLKHNIRELDTVEEVDFLDDAFFDQLHDKIMAKVEQTEVAQKPVVSMPIKMTPKSRGWLNYGLSSMFAMGLVATIAVTMFSVTGKVVARGSNRSSDIFIQQSLDAPEKFSSAVSYQTESDFFVDLAGENLDDLSIEKINRALSQ